MLLAKTDHDWILETSRRTGGRFSAWISNSARYVRAFGNGATEAEAVDDAVRDHFDSGRTTTFEDQNVRDLHWLYLHPTRNHA